MATSHGSSTPFSPQTPARILPSTPCDQALAAWLKQHLQYIRGQTPRTYEQYVKALSSYFRQTPLKKIGITEVRGYQDSRKQKCVATRVNAELSNLQMCMREAGLWDKRIAPVYQALPVPKTKVRQNMSEEEERRLIEVALDPKVPRRLLAGHCLVVMANTSMGFGELRHLRRCNVFLTEDIPFVEVNGGTKNDYRIRSIPLNAIALRSMRWIIKRWEKLGGSDPEHYILPHRARRTREERSLKGHKPTSPPIFAEPMGHIYRAAKGILKDAGLPHLDPYDMRSHFITKILSDLSVSEQTGNELFGHASKAMRSRYSKQRMENKRVAIDAMCRVQVDLSERQLEQEIEARKQQVELAARAELGLSAPPQVRITPLGRLDSGPRRRMKRSISRRRPSPDIKHPAIQAEIARQVALALQQAREQTGPCLVTPIRQTKNRSAK